MPASDFDDVILTSRLGKFKFQAVSATRVSGRIGDETGDGYVNSGPSWEYRKAHYIGSAYFAVSPDGTLRPTETSFVRTLAFGKNHAPQSYVTAMVGAMAESIATYLAENPGDLIEAEREQLKSKLHDAIDDEDKARSVLHAAERKVTDIRARLAALEQSGQ